MPLSQYHGRSLLESLNHHSCHLRRRSLTQRAIHRTREAHLQNQIDLRPRPTRRARTPFLRRLAVRRGRLERELPERPPRQQRREYRPVPRRLLRIVFVSRVLVVMRQPTLRDRRLRVAGHGFQDRVR